MPRLRRPQDVISKKDLRKLYKFTTSGNLIEQAERTMGLGRCPICGVKVPLKTEIKEYNITFLCTFCNYKRVFVWTEKKKTAWEKFVKRDPTLTANIIETFQKEK